MRELREGWGLMARFKVTHSDDACFIDIRGDLRGMAGRAA